MHRIDAPGFAPGNLFTEGNPSLGIPATQVSDDWLNDVQEEIANTIEGAGITLVKGTQNQLLNSILTFIGLGGSQIKIDPLLNATADQVVTGFVLDKVNFKGAVAFYDIHRESDSSNVQEIGMVCPVYDPKDDVWRVTKMIFGLDDSGCDFNITAAGQVRITTDSLAGANYDGQLRVLGIYKFSI